MNKSYVFRPLYPLRFLPFWRSSSLLSIEGTRQWKRWLLCFLLFSALLLCSGCSWKQGEGQTAIFLYYVTHSEENARQTSVLTPYPTDLSPEETGPEDLMARLSAPPNDAMLSPLPSGTQLLSCLVEDSVAHVDVSSPYETLSGYELTVSNYAVCLTLSQLPSIETVVITVEGQPLSNWEQSALQVSDAVLSSTEQEYTSIEVALYFYDEKTSELQAEYRSIFLEEETRLAKRIVTELINGPETESLLGLLPYDTKLLDLTLEDGCCLLTLSNAFWENPPDSPALQQLTIDSIVNSLTNLEFVQSVRFLSPDLREPVYGSLVLDLPLTPGTPLPS